MIVHRLNISDQWFNAEEWRTLADIAYKARRYEHYQRCIENVRRPSITATIGRTCSVCDQGFLG
jgi:hypothetical protein